MTVPLCASTGTLNLAGYTMSAWMLLAVSQGTLPMNAANLAQGFTRSADTPTSGEANTAVAFDQTNLNQWVHLQGSIIQASSLNGQAGLSIEFPIADPNSEGFSGTLYIDDVQLIPP